MQFAKCSTTNIATVYLQKGEILKQTRDKYTDTHHKVKTQKILLLSRTLQGRLAHLFIESFNIMANTTNNELLEPVLTLDISSDISTLSSQLSDICSTNLSDSANWSLSALASSPSQTPPNMSNMPDSSLDALPVSVPRFDEFTLGFRFRLSASASWRLSFSTSSRNSRMI